MAVNNTNKKIFKNCAPFTNCITEINNTQVAQKIDVVVLIYNFRGIFPNNVPGILKIGIFP